MAAVQPQPWLRALITTTTTNNNTNNPPNATAHNNYATIYRQVFQFATFRSGWLNKILDPFPISPLRHVPLSPLDVTNIIRIGSGEQIMKFHISGSFLQSPGTFSYPPPPSPISHILSDHAVQFCNTNCSVIPTQTVSCTKDAQCADTTQSAGTSASGQGRLSWGLLTIRAVTCRCPCTANVQCSRYLSRLSCLMLLLNVASSSVRYTSVVNAIFRHIDIGS
jgi:hypothetical protein